jgi:hypothetical protein
VSERRLISLISGKGKSPEQLKAEAWAPFLKWQEAQRAPESDGPDSQ